jgi:hypothetical protein
MFTDAKQVEEKSWTLSFFGRNLVRIGTHTQFCSQEEENFRTKEMGYTPG